MPKTEHTELSPQAEERITRVVRSLIEDRVNRGIDLARPMHCNSCDLDKPALGATQYGAYQLCNDCLLDFTLALARGEVESVAEYMTRRPDDAAPPSSSDASASGADRTLPISSVAKRGEKLMPSNEPC